MDGAKAIAVEATHPGTAWDYLWFRETQPSSATLPVIAVSTTSGTGSQLTQVAVITKTDERCKSAIYNDIILPRVAVVDPELMLSVPPRMTAFTGFDALTHAFESFLHPNCDALVDMMAREAISIVLKWLPVAVADGKNLEARCQMALADSLAGMCILRAGVTLPHGMGMAIGGMYPHVAHGQALAIVYPAFLGYTHAAAVRQFAWLAHQIDPATKSLDDAAAAAAAAPLLTGFIERIGIAQKTQGRERAGERPRSSDQFLLSSCPTTRPIRASRRARRWLSWCAPPGKLLPRILWKRPWTVSPATARS